MAREPRFFKRIAIFSRKMDGFSLVRRQKQGIQRGLRRAREGVRRQNPGARRRWVAIR
jgi:hypothetical protein